MVAESRDLRRWLSAGAQAIKRARLRLDSINVFPIADADTGTNMFLTLQEGNRAVAKLPSTASHREVVAAFARGALLGARGNSGVILSQYLSAFLVTIDHEGGLGSAGAVGVSRALEAAAAAAYGAVGAPVEGTMLSVARAAAEGAAKVAGAPEAPKRGIGALLGSKAAKAPDGIARRDATIVAAVVAARTALRSTTEDLPQAKQAGVVDAGGAGLLLQLEMLAEILAGPSALDGIESTEWEISSTQQGLVAVLATHTHEPGLGAYEVMFVASEPRKSALAERAALTAALTAIGDSVAVTGTHGLVQAHVHTDHPDEAVALGVERRASQIVVNSLAMGHDSDRSGTGVVALTACPGLAAPLADAGAVVLVVPNAAQLKRRELRRALGDASGRFALVVAGSPELRAAAAEMVAKTGRSNVKVLDASHEAQVIAAVAAAALATPGEPLEEVMTKAISTCRVASSGPLDAVSVATSLLGPQVDVVSIVWPPAAATGPVDQIRKAVLNTCPTADVHVYQGGHSSSTVLIGVESAV